jgi:ABC-type sulfate/molybdate transport systems ATPase subunit
MLQVTVEKQWGAFSLNKSWQVRCGEIIGLFGPSGSGKTATLKCIAGLLKPDAGAIVLNGKALYHSAQGICLSPQARQVGYVPQDYALFPHLTVFDNISFGIRRSCSREEKALVVASLLKKAGLENKKHSYPRELSGGQKQRVALLRAMAGEPRVLLLDEPLTSVDLYWRHTLRREIREFLHDLNIPVVLVTHDFNDVDVLCDTLAMYGSPHKEQLPPHQAGATFYLAGLRR